MSAGDVGSFLTVAFLVTFYVGLIIVVATPVFKWIAAYVKKSGVLETTPGRAVRAAFWSFDPLERIHAPAEAFDTDSMPFARLLMDENRRISESRVETIHAIEKKATSYLVVAGVILGLLAAFGQNVALDLRAIPVGMLLVSILAYIRAGSVYTDALPSMGQYLLAPVGGDPHNEVRVALAVAAAWNERSLDLEIVDTTKARYVKTGNIWFVGALLAILIIVIVPPPQMKTAAGPGNSSTAVPIATPMPPMHTLDGLRPGQDTP